jgi:RHS repeat-associated protein
MSTNAYNFTYGYDEKGNRVTKSGNSVNEYYLRDQTGKELAVYTTGTSTIKMINIYGTGLIGKYDLTGTPANYYYVKDHLGSTRSVVNSSGTPVSAQDYYAYGGLLNQSVSGDDRYKFTGKQRDDETNYDCFGARYYNSDVGVWPSVDTSADKNRGLSPFNYCENNPLKNIDIDGKDIIILNAPTGAANAGIPFGHAAVLIGNDKDGWTYISKDGTKNGINGIIGKPIATELRYHTFQEFANNINLGRKHQYTRAFRITSATEQDKEMVNAAEKSANSLYIVIIQSCIDVASAALGAGGFNPGYEFDSGGISMSPIPNRRYEAIQNDNKGTDVSSGIVLVGSNPQDWQYTFPYYPIFDKP